MPDVVNGAITSSAGRPSRFHTEKAQFALRSVRDAADAAYALVTALLRKYCGYRPVRPWITANAFRYIQANLAPSARVFEWGCGMSTLWYERHCAEVHAVEHDPTWYSLVRQRARSARLYLLSETAYTTKIHDFPEDYFDLICVDGLYRHACLQGAIAALRPGGLLVVDNTDKDRTGGDMFRADALLASLPGFTVQRFVGFAPANFFAEETTICRKAFARASTCRETRP